MSFNCIPFSDSQLEDVMNLNTNLTSNPKDWTFEVIEADEENDMPTIIFFKFKNDENWDSFVPFTFEQNLKEIYYSVEMELYAEEFENGEDDVYEFCEFLKTLGFEEE